MDTGGVLGPFVPVAAAAGLLLGEGRQGSLLHVQLEVNLCVAGFAIEVLMYRPFDGSVVAVKTNIVLGQER